MPTVNDHLSAIRAAADDIARELTALAEKGVTVGVEVAPEFSYSHEGGESVKFVARVGPYVGRQDRIIGIPYSPICA